MALPSITLGTLSVSRFILGSNPFSGFSHQSPAMDADMVHYFTCQKIKETLQQAESLGITTLIARADHHIIRMLMEYWDEGGTLRWIAQTCPELGMPAEIAQKAIKTGASAVYIHGGQMDTFKHHNQQKEVQAGLDVIHNAGVPAGVAGHIASTHTWAAEHFDFEFHMCSYYNPSDRTEFSAHKSGITEVYAPEDRDAMVATIARLEKPAIHYKVLAAGRHDPVNGLQFVAQHLRPCDAVCIGVFPKAKPEMLAENTHLFKSICLHS